MPTLRLLILMVLIPLAGWAETVAEPDQPEEPPPAIESVPAEAPEATLEAVPTAPTFGPGLTPTTDHSLDTLGTLSPMRYFGTLVVIVALIGGGALVLARWRRRWPGQHRAGQLRVLQRQVIDSRHGLVVVRMHGEELLLGTGPAAVTLLGRYAVMDGEDAEHPESLPLRDGGEAASFDFSEPAVTLEGWR